MERRAYSDMLNAIPMPCLAIDRSERIMAANTDALTLLGQGILERNYVTMLRQPSVLDAVEVTLKDGTPRMARYYSNDGVQDTTFEVTCRRIDSLDNALGRVVVLSFRDTSLEEQGEEMRRNFVANVSHELRTPLTALMGFIETLRGPAKDDPAAAMRFLDIMQGEGERMNRLVGDLLSLSRVEGDERVRPTTRIALVDVIDSAMRSIGPLAQEAQVELERQFDLEAISITADADQLTQVFTNLMENALKYGGSGGRITVSLSHKEREPALRAAGVRVRVRDYGPGIDPVHLPRLTERFYRADDHRSRAMGGTGLGLAIVKHIVNRHRGRLRIDSEVGQGTSVTVILPVAQAGFSQP